MNSVKDLCNRIIKDDKCGDDWYQNLETAVKLARIVLVMQEALEKIKDGAKFMDKSLTGNNGIAMLTPILIAGLVNGALLKAEKIASHE